jgi:hypothetical protein
MVVSIPTTNNVSTTRISYADLAKKNLPHSSRSLPNNRIETKSNPNKKTWQDILQESNQSPSDWWDEANQGPVGDDVKFRGQSIDGDEISFGVGERGKVVRGEGEEFVLGIWLNG